MSTLAGTRLGPYEILSPLGAGGMGEVWRARDSRLSREVAIKVLPADVAEDSSRLKRFEKEARAASALNHPNIVTIYDIGSTDSVAWIAMERVEGKTLRELLFGGALSVRRLLQVSAQIADGLSKAHEAGIVHRDLKPENVMVTKDGLVKILDFGLAKQIGTVSGSDEGSRLPTETGTSPGVVLGTVGYMSPEQAAGQLVDFRSDQFSFGSILYEMATGKRAFEKGTAVDTLSAILHEEPRPVGELNSEAPAPLRWTVERCLAKEAGDRYASTKDLARELASIRDHFSEASLTVGEPGAKPAPARRLAAWAGLVLLGGLAIGIFAGRPLWKAAFSVRPTLRQITFRGIGLSNARFAPDGQIVYSEGAFDLVSTRPGAREPHPLGLPKASLMSISSLGDLAILVGGGRFHGTLATVPLAGGSAPRELLENVRCAGWAPDGKSLAVIHVVEGKMRLEFPIGKVLYQPPGLIHGCAFSPKGDLIAFNDFAYVQGALNERHLQVTDLAGRRKSVANAPYEYEWSPSGDEIWFNDIRDGTTELHAVTLSGQRRFLASFPGDFTLDDISRDGRVLLERVTEENGMIGRIGGEADERNLAWLDGSRPADLSADGMFLLFTETYHGGGPNRAVYKRRTDGSPAVRLGEGLALALSPDGKWALAHLDAAPSRLTLVPTGAGPSRTVSLGGIQLRGGGKAFFFPDGNRVLLEGAEPGHTERLYAIDLESGKARPITPEGIPFGADFALSPDGRRVVSPSADNKKYIFDLEDGSARPLPGDSEGMRVLRWCADGRSIFVGVGTIRSFKVYRQDLSSGARELWREFSASAVGGGLMTVIPTPDGKSYVYGYTKWGSDLFLAEGLK